MSDTFNAADYLVTRHVAEGRGDAPRCSRRTTLTYAELDDRVGVVGGRRCAASGCAATTG